MRDVPRSPDLFELEASADEATVRLEDLREAVDRLPPDLREVVNALIWERIGTRALAARLSVSREEVVRRWVRAQRALRKTKAVKVQAAHRVGPLSAAPPPRQGAVRLP